MAYVTGSAGDMSSLRVAFFNALTDNGWTLSGDIIYRGDVYIEILVASGYLTLQGGTGLDGTTLENRTERVVRIGRPSTSISDLTWPLSYQVFIGTLPDEVYLVINYDVDKYQFAAFGLSSVSDLPGTGTWICASLSYYNAAVNNFINIRDDGGGSGSTYYPYSMGLFWTTNSGEIACNCYVHHGLDGGGWSDNSTLPSAILGVTELISASPNEWNSEAVLIPILVWLPRSDNKLTMVADLAHARYLRVDNHNPDEIITIGSDRYKVFPFYIKNLAERNGGASVDHTGTFGFAVRYDGP